jgi:hypothetical protein
MKKLLMIGAAALFVGWSGASAIAGDFTLFECAGFRATPPEIIDRDPVVKTSVAIYFARTGTQPSSFEVTHATLAGEKYERENQYRDIRTWANRGGDYWSGISITNPRRTMIGQLIYDDSRGISARRYIEKSFVNGKLERTTTSTCVWADQ